MLECRLSRKAEADLESLIEYTVERFGIRQARIYCESIFRAFDLLCESPNLGTNQGHILPNMRRLTHESHGIYYRVDGNDVVIVRILGPGQDPTRNFA